MWGVETLTVFVCKDAGLHNDATPKQHSTANGLIASKWIAIVLSAVLS